MREVCGCVPILFFSLFFFFFSLSFLDLLSGEDLSWPENVQVFDRCWMLSKAQWLLENEGIGHVVVVPESFSDGSPLAGTSQVLRRCLSCGLRGIASVCECVSVRVRA